MPVQLQQHLHAEQRIASSDAQQHSDQLSNFRCDSLHSINIHAGELPMLPVHCEAWTTM